MKFLFLEHQPSRELDFEIKEQDYFSYDLPVECRFQNGWDCRLCGCLTEHNLVDGCQICSICGTSIRAAEKTITASSFERLCNAFHVSSFVGDWSTLLIYGVDYTETFGRDRQTGKIIFHKLNYRRSVLRYHRKDSGIREISACGVWLDGKQLYSYTEMENMGVTSKRSVS